MNTAALITTTNLRGHEFRVFRLTTTTPYPAAAYDFAPSSFGFSQIVAAWFFSPVTSPNLAGGTCILCEIDLTNNKIRCYDANHQELAQGTDLSQYAVLLGVLGN